MFSVLSEETQMHASSNSSYLSCALGRVSKEEKVPKFYLTLTQAKKYPITRYVKYMNRIRDNSDYNLKNFSKLL